MSFSIEKLPDEPIVICTLDKDFRGAEYNGFLSELGKLLEGEPGPVYRITYSLAITPLIFSDIVTMLGEETKSGKPGTITDPRIRMIIVSAASDAQFPIDSVKQDQYGAFDVPLFATVDEALAYARAELNA